MNQQPNHIPVEAHARARSSTVQFSVQYSREFPTTLHRWCGVRPYLSKEGQGDRVFRAEPTAATLLAQLFAIAPRNRAEHLTPLKPPSAARASGVKGRR